MRYSKDLKKRVIDFIKSGGSKAKASKIYTISRSTIYIWMSQDDAYQARKPGPKDSRKFSRLALKQEIDAKPDSLLKELAEKFNVSMNAISHALRRLGIVRKKRPSATRKA